MRTGWFVAFGLAALILSCGAATDWHATGAEPPAMFETSVRCQGCHNGIQSASGDRLSIGVEWRGSMMAQSARDPYWQAAVRGETLDHPRAAAAIEHECSRCHMPMAHVTQVAAGGRGQVFSQVPAGYFSANRSSAARPARPDGSMFR